MLRDRVIEEHHRRFGTVPALYAAPGRVNLIGEHTDYNDGFVLPMAIERETIAGIAANDRREHRVHSLELRETAHFSLEQPFARRGDWSDYAGGMLAALREDVPFDTAFDMTIGSTIPLGAGLSSSAAFEIAIARAVFAASNVDAPGERLALVGRRAEHDFVGIRSGAMDQMVCALAQKGCTFFLDCRSLTYAHIAMPAGAGVVVMHSGVKHSLASSEYNVRREQCETAVALMRDLGAPIDALRDLTPEAFQPYESRLPSPARERARHVIYENARTLDAVRALEIGDLPQLGRLMNESHESLRALYEVSTPELDDLAQIARNVDGAFGARMTGGGFGGCVIALASETSVNRVQDVVRGAYYEARNIEPVMFVTRASEGAASTA